MKIFFKQNNKGFTLVETLVAVSIFTMSLLGIMSILASSIADTTYAKQKMTATYLAQEGIEYMRNVRDTNMFYVTDPNTINPDPNYGWAEFKKFLIKCTSSAKCGFSKADYASILSYSDNIFNCNPPSQGCGLLIDGTTGLYNSGVVGGTDSGFTRTIWMTKADGSTGGVEVGDNEVKIFSEVSWTTGSGLHKVTFSENLFNWWYVVE